MCVLIKLINLILPVFVPKRDISKFISTGCKMENLNETWNFKKLYGPNKKIRCNHNKYSKFFF